MTNKTFTKSRRNFLKGAAYSSALSLGGLSGLAFAAKSTSPEKAFGVKASADLTNSGLSIMQQKTLTGETVTLINQSNKMIMLNALQPISLEQVNGSLIVKVNQIESEAFNGMIAVSPSERISFDIKSVGSGYTSNYRNADILPLANSYENHLQITSEHSIFNRVVPVNLVYQSPITHTK